MGRTATKDMPRFRKVYKETGEVQNAMLAAGYTQATAHQGIRALPKATRLFVLRHKAKADKLIKLGSAITAEDQENLVRGRLLANTVTGKDQAVNSAKLLGQDKRVAMFTPDSMTGVIVINHPPTLPALDMPSLPSICTPSAGD